MLVDFYVRQNGASYDVYNKEFLAKKVVKQGDEEYPLDTEERINKWFAYKNIPLTKCSMHLKDCYTDGDNSKVEARLLEFDKEQGIWKRNDNRFGGVFIETVVMSWNMTKLNTEYTATESGVAAMEYQFADKVKSLVQMAVAIGGRDDSDPFAPLTS